MPLRLAPNSIKRDQPCLAHILDHAIRNAVIVRPFQKTVASVQCGGQVQMTVFRRPKLNGNVLGEDTDMAGIALVRLGEEGFCPPAMFITND